MLRFYELTDDNSCLNRSGNYEMVFVLVARDPVAPLVIYLWCLLRILIRRNRWKDKKIQEAIHAARTMKTQYQDPTIRKGAQNSD